MKNQLRLCAKKGLDKSKIRAQETFILNFGIKSTDFNPFFPTFSTSNGRSLLQVRTLMGYLIPHHLQAAIIAIIVNFTLEIITASMVADKPTCAICIDFPLFVIFSFPLPTTS
ncbi:hypothetical protein PHYBLDRAFT_174015 [Phycomyces blakesleeanus NRRL 1555(-)]|uniref:Uncharacterized protein n=1 Tax=Phycomyces blakesleeanus (strain ATCC 8743b / DSM 1359 / FGSC 10004 / NBRC 33097 / NRRL 1555) TaxID=763407 RepID=A0A167KBI2_PHYB8|nr:hypothetical protein PHYBLDRAFT_174015 [Phycomyces blakesleeanus NRRL 1555(-)]OAD67686.1 hypothetical protein PHYBLDRAFT_174015 [Phycomyces blakesleeanus NRRL 1555(-)]|eukprot:XP_018285726.1 hypothetical protein PHYBLDRAFT_174015 [Phycomyces blakesleeanus NRRL 1555(-)]